MSKRKLPRMITADQYRLSQGGDFDQVWLPADGDRAKMEVLDVEHELNDGRIILDTNRGPARVPRDQLLIVK